jgi:hypothetical protein
MPKKKKAETQKTTKCIICGDTIKYKTKMPSKCKKCQGITTTQKVTPKTKWKKETQMMRAMGELLPDAEYIINGYYSWLPSPKGMPLQIDWYCPSLKLGVEFDGAQHHEYIKYYHKTKQQFYYLQECDQIKDKICSERGITLLKIPYNTTLTVSSLEAVLKSANPKLHAELVANGAIRRKESN